ncbi:phage tail protein [Histophilus somni]|uniref:phage tail protein n=1 Tax=Histophilus somni TaxID=731 RepID=UPI00201EE912|nr:phage tail protein [Histophilus somni]
MLMSLGMFVFGLHTAPFEQLSRNSQWRWQSHNRTGADLAYQFTGRGEESITLTGVLMPEISGGVDQLDMLRQMADQGEPHLLTAGSGEVYGYYVIESLSENHSALLIDGTAQKIEFSLALKRYKGTEQKDTVAPMLPLFLQR